MEYQNRMDRAAKERRNAANPCSPQTMAAHARPRVTGWERLF